jgi:hypothetical protein
VAPSIFDPTGLSFSGQPIKSSIQFTTNLASDIELTVQDTVTGAVINRLLFPGIQAGTSTVFWNGKSSDDRYVAPGTYRLGLTAIQRSGQRSMSGFLLQRVYY